MKLFKFLGITLMMTLCAGFISCSDDDEEESTPAYSADALVGEWWMTCEEYTESWSDEVDVFNCTPSEEYRIIFNSDKSGLLESGSNQIMEHGGHYNFTWNISGDKIVAWMIYNYPSSSGATGYEATWQIISLTGDELVLKKTDIEGDDSWSWTSHFIRH